MKYASKESIRAALLVAGFEAEEATKIANSADGRVPNETPRITRFVEEVKKFGYQLAIQRAQNPLPQAYVGWGHKATN